METMGRVAFFSPAAELGGAERSLLDLIVALKQAVPGLDLSIVFGTDGPFVGEAEKQGLTVRVVPMPRRLSLVGDSALHLDGGLGATLSMAGSAGPAGLAALRYARQLRRVFGELMPAVIHTNGNKAHLLASALNLEGVAVVWHVRDFIGSRRLMGRALRWVSSRAAGAVAISRAVGRDLALVTPNLPVEVVYNGIDTDHFSPGSEDGRLLDELAGMRAAEDGTVRVGLVATYARWKGQSLFLDAVARLAAAPPPDRVRFFVIGGPIYSTGGSQWSERELRQRATDLGISAGVGFIGFQYNIADVYRRLDLVVHASTSPEPFGRTIVEAMSCAKPVIVADAGGAVELFDHDVDAVGFRAGDGEALAETIRDLVSDPDRRARLGERARRSAVARFSRERLGPEMMAAYQRFLAIRNCCEPGR